MNQKILLAVALVSLVLFVIQKSEATSLQQENLIERKDLETEPQLATCKCKNGFCEKDKNGKLVCKCPPEYGLYESECYECECGKAVVTCSWSGFFGRTKKCICKKGYADVKGTCTGDCKTNPCENGGTCRVAGKDITCDCVPPYSGENCKESNKGPCNPNPCRNNATCETKVGKAKCMCKSPYTGDFCEKDPCTPNPCKYDGKCTIKTGKMNCTCKPPYSGDLCEKDPCTPNPCKYDGKCSIKSGKMNCTCKPPYSGDLCEKNPCTPNPCKYDGTCSIKNGKLNCTCKPPYSGNLCEKDPCTPNPCKYDGKCSIKSGKLNCTCKPPYSGNFCEKDPCTPNPCKYDGKCSIKSRKLNCACKPPYSGDLCEKDPCTPNPCKYDGKCSIKNGKINCTCKPPYTGDLCEKDPCTPNPCKYDGKCSIKSGKLNCTCKPPYSGNLCEKDPCVPNPCKYDGKCSIKSGKMNCTCKPPYSGDLCDKDPCVPNPCKFDGKCSIKSGKLNCACKPPYSGDLCDKDPCMPNPCKYDGKCSIKSGKLNCTCKPPYSGDFCEKDPCTPNPCKYDGKCSIKSGKMNCTCKPPYSGDLCEKDPCTPNPCKYDGKCSIKSGKLNCTCKPPYSGDLCDRDPCVPNPCKYGGKCSIKSAKLNCTCKFPYYGDLCEKVTPSTSTQVYTTPTSIKSSTTTKLPVSSNKTSTATVPQSTPPTSTVKVVTSTKSPVSTTNVTTNTTIKSTFNTTESTVIYNKSTVNVSSTVETTPRHSSTGTQAYRTTTSIKSSTTTKLPVSSYKPSAATIPQSTSPTSTVKVVTNSTPPISTAKVTTDTTAKSTLNTTESTVNYKSTVNESSTVEMTVSDVNSTSEINSTATSEINATVTPSNISETTTEIGTTANDSITTGGDGSLTSIYSTHSDTSTGSDYEFTTVTGEITTSNPLTTEPVEKKCKKNICLNGGICIETETGQVCRCVYPYGGKLCNDSSWCIEGLGKDVCKPQKNCVFDFKTKVGSCNCSKNEYYDYEHQVCRTIDKCPFMPDKCKGVNEVCRNNECTCKENFQKNNQTVCVPNFCASANISCGENADCRDVEKDPGTVECVCKDNYVFNGKACVPVNKCNLPGVLNCQQICNETTESCDCYPEYTLQADLKSCKPANDSTTCKKTCGAGVCVKTEQGEEICICPLTQNFNGKTCVDLCTAKKVPKGICPKDECLPDESQGFRCKCEGLLTYDTNNVTCRRKLMCSEGKGSGMCLTKSAKCVEDLSEKEGFRCECPAGADFDNNGTCKGKCQLLQNIDTCRKKLAVCIMDGDDFICKCPPMVTANKDGICTELAPSSYLGTFPFASNKYTIISKSQKAPIKDVDYLKLRKDLRDSMKLIFGKLYKFADILDCNYTTTGLTCLVEVQFDADPKDQVKLIDAPGTCISADFDTCFIPPELVLRKKVITSELLTKTDPCRQQIKEFHCGGAETECKKVGEDGRNFNCSCAKGFTSYGTFQPVSDTRTIADKCRDINECLLAKACPNRTRCLNTPGSYECMCQKGFRQTKESADPKLYGCVDLCSPNPCGNGKCEVTWDQFRCRCNDGYMGYNCDTRVKHEETSPGLKIALITLSTIVIPLALLAAFVIHKYRILEKKLSTSSYLDDNTSTLSMEPLTRPSPERSFR